MGFSSRNSVHMLRAFVVIMCFCLSTARGKGYFDFCDGNKKPAACRRMANTREAIRMIAEGATGIFLDRDGC